ncbi:hypothetical protein FV226_24590 [Methylobacterium sp. WL12]|uniref:hypothetical protein n=1 Tax=Methylobacterium sp. WL12 TaxID=2603890 RepID=UPI0011C8C41B|nr:hypothetical protein [Methylobacterium sp. WL12]TXM65673.1 hypothetical protein FV226_24590 [Methylobacterium sp. WL12]
MPDIAWLADLLKRAPLMHVDMQEAEKAGDAARLAYGRAVQAWRAEVALALTEAHHPATDEPDAFARTATASALLRLEAAE